MKPFLIIPFFALAACVSAGCSIAEHPAIPASVPGGRFGQSNKVAQAGPYVLYRVTQIDDWGAPVNAQKVATVNLQANETVGFQYVLAPKDQFYYPDAHSDVVAYAGATRFNLGPITSIQEKYYWADPNEWDNYWSLRPERVLARRFTMY